MFFKLLRISGNGLITLHEVRAKKIHLLRNPKACRHQQDTVETKKKKIKLHKTSYEDISKVTNIQLNIKINECSYYTCTDN